jgi:hypothetical protein
VIFPANARNGDLNHTLLRAENTRFRHGGSLTSSPYDPRTVFIPSFILRYETSDRVSEMKIEALDISDDLVDRWDVILWRSLTPSDYERVKLGFVLKLWRRPHWVQLKILRKDGAAAQARLRTLLKTIDQGDTLWLAPARAGGV